MPSELMLQIGAPELSVEFALSLFIPFVIGLLIGLALKQLVKLAVALIALVALLMGFGYVSPQAIASLFALFQAYGPELIARAERIAGFIPYSSLTFFLGLAVGFLKS